MIQMIKQLIMLTVFDMIINMTQYHKRDQPLHYYILTGGAGSWG